MRKRTLPWRALVGLALIGVSVMSVVLIVSPSRQTTEVLVATRNIAPGEDLSSDNVQSVEVPESSIWDVFAGPQDLDRRLSTSVVIPEGDGVLLSALGERGQSDHAVVTFSLSVGKPRWLVPGQAVDLWAAAPGGENSFLIPFVVAPSSVLVDARQEEGFAADTQSSQVDVVIARRSLPGVVHALANNYFLYLTPRTGGPQ